MEIVRRYADFDSAEMRADDDGPSLDFRGHAAVFNSPTLIGSRDWGFVEWLSPGAFTPVLGDDVRFLFNHDGLPLARTTNGTLTLSEDRTGLLSNAQLADVSLSRDIAQLVTRGDLSQMSFAFYYGKYSQGRIDVGDPERGGHAGVDIPDDFDGLRYIQIETVRQLFDVSVVTYPAYPATDAGMRSLNVAKREIDAIMATFPDEQETVDYQSQLIDLVLKARGKVSPTTRFCGGK